MLWWTDKKLKFTGYCNFNESIATYWLYRLVNLRDFRAQPTINCNRIFFLHNIFFKNLKINIKNAPGFE